MQEILAWIWAPVVLLVVCLGLGLLVEAVSRARLPDGLLAPVGFCAGVLLMGPLYHLGLHVPVTTVLVAAVAVAGLLTQRRRLRALRPGAASLAAAAAYGLYLAPTALTGHWTWAGYNFTNDPANTLTGTWWILGHGYDSPASVHSVTDVVAAGTVDQGYPLGAHLLLGTLRPMVGVDLVALYQPGIAFAAALLAAGFVVLVQRAGLPRLWAAGVAVAAVGANLLYAYGQLGGLKEIVSAMALATASAVAAQSHPATWSRGTVALVVVPLAALVPVLSAGGIAYAAVFGLIVAVVAVVPFVTRRRSSGLLALAGKAAFGALLFVLLSAFVLHAALEFGSTVNSELSGAVLGQLLRPLPLEQIGGIWWAADWRLPLAPGWRWDLNQVLLVLVFAFAAAGAVAALRRRRGLVLVGLATAAVLLLVLAPRTSPYGDSKLLVLITPYVVLTAGIGAWALTTLPRRAVLRALGAVGGIAVVAGIVVTDATTYHVTRFAPTARIEALEDVAHAAEGKGLVLHNEFEEWLKYFYRDAEVSSGGEVWLNARSWELRKNIPVLGDVYDLDEMRLSYVTSFPAIVTRTSPAASRPPANFELSYRNRYYELWVRRDQQVVVHHLPIQGLFVSEVQLPCRSIMRFARQAGPGDTLVAARTPRGVTMQPTEVTHSATFTAPPGVQGITVPAGPGFARASARFRAGTYSVWLYGSSGRPVSAIVDGRKVGAMHEVNTLEQWVPVGTVTLREGTHRLEIRRPGGSLAPGDGYAGMIGPMALEPVSARDPELLRVAPDQARRLCEAGPLDWVEITRPAR